MKVLFSHEELAGTLELVLLFLPLVWKGSCGFLEYAQGGLFEQGSRCIFVVLAPAVVQEFFCAQIYGCWQRCNGVKQAF